MLISNRAKFLLVGAHALAQYGVVRATQDIDLFVDPSAANVTRVQSAIREFGLPKLAEAAALLAEAWRSRKKTRLGQLPVHVIDLPTYLKNKQASGRPKDLLDIELLRERGLIAKR